jgi:UDP-N-acetylglucosamine:LPS N-acetylglucosamine transferase
MIDEAALTGEVLAERIHYYGGRPEALRRMAERSTALGRPDAATRIVDECCRLVAGCARRAADRSPHQRADGLTHHVP